MSDQQTTSLQNAPVVETSFMIRWFITCLIGAAVGIYVAGLSWGGTVDIDEYVWSDIIFSFWLQLWAMLMIVGWALATGPIHGLLRALRVPVGASRIGGYLISLGLVVTVLIVVDSAISAAGPEYLMEHAEDRIPSLPSYKELSGSFGVLAFIFMLSLSQDLALPRLRSNRGLWLANSLLGGAVGLLVGFGIGAVLQITDYRTAQIYYLVGMLAFVALGVTSGQALTIGLRKALAWRWFFVGGLCNLLFFTIPPLLFVVLGYISSGQAIFLKLFFILVYCLYMLYPLVTGLVFSRDQQR